MGFDESMGLEWDDEKSALCKRRRGYLLQDLAKMVFSNPVGEYTHRDYPEQIRRLIASFTHWYSVSFPQSYVLNFLM